MRQLYTPQGHGQIDGHSMRRTGAQLLASAGVPVETIMWFGRWGSNAIRAYIEDSVSKAPGASSLAMAVARGLARESDSRQEGEQAGADGREVAELRREVANLKLLVRGANDLPALEDGPPDVRFVRFLRGKTHVAHACAASGAPSGRTALCGWSFGALSAKEVVVENVAPAHSGEVCKSCLRSCGALGVTVPEAGGPTSSDSSSSGRSDSSG